MLQILQVINTYEKPPIRALRALPHEVLSHSHPCPVSKPDSNAAVLAVDRDIRDLEISFYIGWAL